MQAPSSKDKITARIQEELCRLKKRDLASLIAILKIINVSTINKKQKIAEEIAERIVATVVTRKSQGQPEQVTLNQIIKILNSSNQHVLVRAVTLCLRSIVEWQGQDSYPPSETHPYSSRMCEPVEVFNNVSHVCLCGRTPTASQDPMICTICFTGFHSQCFKVPLSEYFQCPHCFVRNMDPLQEVVRPLFTGYLRAGVRYHLINLNLEELAGLQESFSLQMRCVRLDGKNNYQPTWPDYCTLCLGDQRVAQFTPLPKNSCIKKRQDIARVLDRKLLTSNELRIYEHTAQPYEEMQVEAADHFFGVYVVRSLSPASLYNKISKEMVLPHELSQQLIKRNFMTDDDVQINHFNVSLKCVYEGRTMKMPARSWDCTHFQCFDLQNTISVISHTQPRRWKCPICKRKSHRIFVDPILGDILKSYSAHFEPLKQIRFFPTGNYELWFDKNPRGKQGSNQQKVVLKSKLEKLVPVPPGNMICIDEESVQEDRSYVAVANIDKKRRFLQQDIKNTRLDQNLDNKISETTLSRPLNNNTMRSNQSHLKMPVRQKMGTLKGLEEKFMLQRYSGLASNNTAKGASELIFEESQNSSQLRRERGWSQSLLNNHSGHNITKRQMMMFGIKDTLPDVRIRQDMCSKIMSKHHQELGYRESFGKLPSTPFLSTSESTCRAGKQQSDAKNRLLHVPVRDIALGGPALSEFIDDQLQTEQNRYERMLALERYMLRQHISATNLNSIGLASTQELDKAILLKISAQLFQEIDLFLK